jgi:transcriptional regulator with XRE-family HTH domain
VTAFLRRWVYLLTAHPERVRESGLKVEIGNRLKRLRLEKGFTQKELAVRVKGGLDYTYIGKIERGEQLPSLKILIKISEALSVPLGYFFRDEALPALHKLFVHEFKPLVKGVKGRNLLTAIESLHEDDIPLLIEIIRLLNRHRNAAKAKLPDTGGEDVPMAAEEGASYGKK